MNHEKRDSAVNDCLDRLFTNGSGQKAERLVLTANEKDLGGWGRPAVRDHLAEVFDAGVNASPAFVVYADGTFKAVDAASSWEYENDPDYLVTVRPNKEMI